MILGYQGQINFVLYLQAVFGYTCKQGWKEKMRKTVLFIYLIFAFLLCRPTYSQTTENNEVHPYFVEPHMHVFGFLACHYPEMNVLLKGHFPAYEFSIGKQTLGNKYWQYRMGYPRFGLSFWYADLANAEILGEAYAFYPFMDFHLYKHKRFTEIMRFGPGLGYVTKVHDRVDNYKNFVVSSALNASAKLHFISRFRFSDRLDLSASIGITHFSNGAFSQPNLGYNLPTLAFASTYKFGTKKPQLDRDTGKKWVDKMNYYVLTGMGIKEMPFDDVYPEKFTVHYTSFQVEKPVSFTNRLTAGLDIFYDNADINKLERDSIPYKKVELLKPGIHLGHNFTFEDFTFSTIVGTYLYRKTKIDKVNYNTLRARYVFWDHYCLSICLKVHLVEADFFGWAVGYKF